MSDPMKGVVNSLPMFFDSLGNPDFGALECYLNILKTCGEPSLIFPMAYNTRIAYLSFEELLELHDVVRIFCKSVNAKWIAVPPYKASEKQLQFFFDRLTTDENLYGASILFPERFYVDDEVFYRYFSVPNEFGIKTVAHEMKMISGKDGSLMDWPSKVLANLPQYCDLVAIKEDSKNDAISRLALADGTYDVLLAGGGMSQVDRLLSNSPRAWLAGVSLIYPQITNLENSLIQSDDKRHRFVEEVEAPFFSLCSNLGWHRVHKGLLSIIHKLPIYEPSPMSSLSNQELGDITFAWEMSIGPAIQKLLSDTAQHPPNFEKMDI
ncbi:hypothetical protein OAP65_04840 [Litorivicinus sp.]|nr:hypothetical protein [Litorivicinus sp.]